MELRTIALGMLLAVIGGVAGSLILFAALVRALAGQTHPEEH